MDPEVRKGRTLEAITRSVSCESLIQPLIIVFEFLHWIDTETQALVMAYARDHGWRDIRRRCNTRWRQ